MKYSVKLKIEIFSSSLDQYRVRHSTKDRFPYNYILKCLFEHRKLGRFEVVRANIGSNMGYPSKSNGAYSSMLKY